MILKLASTSRDSRSRRSPTPLKPTPPSPPQPISPPNPSRTHTSIVVQSPENHKHTTWARPRRHPSRPACPERGRTPPPGGPLRRPRYGRRGCWTRSRTGSAGRRSRRRALPAPPKPSRRPPDTPSCPSNPAARLPPSTRSTTLRRNSAGQLLATKTSSWSTRPRSDCPERATPGKQTLQQDQGGSPPGPPRRPVVLHHTHGYPQIEVTGQGLGARHMSGHIAVAEGGAAWA